LAALLAPAAACAEVIVRPTVSTGVRYNSNAFVRSENEEVEGDIITTVSPQIEAVSERGRLTLEGRYTAGADICLYNSECNALNHYAEIGASMVLSKYTSVTAEDSVDYTMESPETTLAGIQTSYARNLYNTVSAGVTHDIGLRNSIALNVADRLSDYSASALVDTRADSVTFSETFAMSPSATLTSSYGYTYYTFDDEGGADAEESHTLNFSLSKVYHGGLEMNLSGGASYAPSMEEGYDWLAGAGITKGFKSLTISATYSRNVSTTAGLTDQMAINERYSMSIERLVSRKFNALLSGHYISNRSKPRIEVDIAAYQFELTGTWRPYSWMAASAGASHFNQTALGSLGDDVRSEEVFVSVSMSAPEWRF
jgi:hypothetical protein